jgi:glycosyltransferase involved in cell wall biosynthesis
MRILHIVHQYLPDHAGGTEYYVRSLALAQRAAGHEPTIFCPRSATGQRLERDASEGIQIYRVVSGRFTPANRFRATFGCRFLTDSLAGVVRQIEPELVHVHHLMGLPANILRVIDGSVPVVATLHDYWWVCANAQLLTNYSGQVCDGPRGWFNCARCGLAKAGAGTIMPVSPLATPLFYLRSRILHQVMPRVAAWIAPTSFVATWHVSHGFPPDRMHVAEHGIDLPTPQDVPQISTGRESETSVHFAYVGGLSPQKGVHVLIEAFNGLPSSARLSIAGDEQAFPEYCAALRQQAKHPGILFVGLLDRPGVWRALASADALVVPSLWYETASLVIQEAFAAGTPVIAADHGALAERVRHEVDGLLVPPGDTLALRSAMRRLMDDSSLLPRLQAGIQPVRGIKDHVQQLESIYRQVLAEAE